jgi:hypothetical protein
VKIKVILQLVIDLIFRSPLKEGSVMENWRVFCGRVSQNSRDYKIVDRSGSDLTLATCHRFLKKLRRCFSLTKFMKLISGSSKQVQIRSSGSSYQVRTRSDPGFLQFLHLQYNIIVLYGIKCTAKRCLNIITAYKTTYVKCALHHSQLFFKYFFFDRSV